MSISAFMTQLGAPPRNVRWSWGSVSPAGVVYLRVWSDEFRTINGMRHARLTNHAQYRSNPSLPGYRERQKHVRLIRQGAQSFCIVCQPTSPSAAPRSILSFSRRLLAGVGVHAHGGDDWLEV